ncbi:MAG: SpaH/EbpB family LPXTG-anchored major pilin [Clostridia bacterium]|nr:SpaH/EbpB family LPXTG-anchored major pilin [Clostridia bacterium]
MLLSSKYKRVIAFLLSALVMLSSFAMLAYAEDGEVTEKDTYILDRDANGDHLYFYQSACVLSRSLSGFPGAPGTPSQVFVYTMYNPVNGDYIPAYCCDIDTTAVLGTDYRRLNLEDSTFSNNAAGLIRAILEEGFYLIPVDGESETDHTTRANAKTAELCKAAGLPTGDLTITEAIAATQAAIWKAIHGADLEIHTFCRQSLVSNIWSSNTRYASLCNRNTVYHKTNDQINATIEAVYNYLISLDPVEAEEKTVSASSFIELNDPVFTKNADGSYDVTVKAIVDVDMEAGDTLSVKASLNDQYIAKVNLINGEQEIVLSLDNVPEAYIKGDIKLSISGYQTSKGYYYFDAEGERGTSQSMVGYIDSRLPVYAEVVAKEDRILNIYKSTNVAVGNGEYENKPLANISFDIFPVATMEEFKSGSLVLPSADKYPYPAKAEYTLTTDKDGKASLNFLHHGLPDGIYLIVEHPHPSIVAPIEPFYLKVPATDPQTGETLYDITIKPKNEVKGSLHIEKDVISIGNEESSVNAYDPHEWIIGATIPEDIVDGESYEITDKLDPRLDFLGNVKVVLEHKGESILTLVPDVDYNLTVTDVDSLSDGHPSDSFKVSLTSLGMSEIADTVGDEDYNDYMLRVYFTAQVNANAEMGKKIPNQAELKYVNAVNFEFDEKSDVPIVYTGGVNLLKVDAEDNSETLAGAVFELYRFATEKEILAGAEGLAEISGVDGTVIKVPFFDNAALSGEKVMSVTSGDDGKVTAYGLVYGEYFLVETQAPTGYNKLATPIRMMINESSHLEQNSILVANSTGSLFPTTGGVGTTIFMVAGAILVLASGVLLFTKLSMGKGVTDEE